MKVLGVDGIEGMEKAPPIVEEEKEGELTFGAIQSSLTQNTIVGSVVNHAMDYGASLFYEEDEQFRQNLGGRFETLTKEHNLNRERAMYVLDNAKNEEHYNLMLMEQQRQQDNALQLEKAGTVGTMFNIGAEILDGIATVGGIAKVAGGLATKFVTAGTQALSRIGLSAKASEYVTKIVGGVGIETGFEFSKQQIVDTQRTELDYAFAVIGGGIGGALSRSTPELKQTADQMGKELNEGLEFKADLEEIPTVEQKKEALEKFQRTKSQQALEKIQFDYNKKFEQSKSPTMQALTQGETPIFYNPRYKTVDNFSADELNRKYNDTILSNFQQEFAEPFAKFQETKAIFRSTAVGRLDFTTQNEFYDYAGRVVHNLVDETNLPPEVLELHESIRKANSRMAEVAYDANVRGGHPLFTTGKVERNPDYLPIKYNLNKVFGDIYSGKIQLDDYVGVITNGLKGTLRNSGVEEELIEQQAPELAKRAKEWVTKQKNRVNSSDKQAMTYLDDADVIDDYESFVDELIEEYGVPEAQAREMSKEATTIKPKTPKDGLSPRSRRRSNIDLTASYTNPETGVTLNLGDYVETKVDMLWKSYGQSMGGDIALRKLGITSRADIKKLRDTVEKELIENYNGFTSSAKSELAVFDDTMRQFLGNPLLDDPEGVLNKSVELLQSGARVSYLGGTWFSMLSEVSAVVMETGISNILRYSPIKDFVKGYGKNTKDVPELLLESRIYNGLGNDAYNHTNRYMYEADNSMGDLVANKSVGMQDKIGKGLDTMLGATKRAEEAITQIGGSKSGQSFLEQMFYTGTSAKLLRQAQKGVIDPKLAKEFGWSPEVAESIRQNILKHADIDGKKVNVFNFAKWDADAELAFNLGVRRYSSTLVQKAYIGDTSAVTLGNDVLKNTWYGKLGTSLMQYAIMANSKQLGRTLANPDTRSLSRMVWHAGGATAGYYAYTYANYWDDPEELYERTQGEGVPRSIMERTPASGIIPIAAGIYEEVTGDSLSSETTTPRGLSTPASLKVGRGMVETFRIGSGFLDDDISISQKRFNNYLDTILPNVLGMRYLNKQISDSLTTDEEIEATWR